MKIEVRLIESNTGETWISHRFAEVSRLPHVGERYSMLIDPTAMSEADRYMLTAPVTEVTDNGPGLWLVRTANELFAIEVA